MNLTQYIALGLHKSARNMFRETDVDGNTILRSCAKEEDAIQLEITDADGTTIYGLFFFQSVKYMFEHKEEIIVIIDSFKANTQSLLSTGPLSIFALKLYNLIHVETIK